MGTLFVILIVSLSIHFFFFKNDMNSKNKELEKVGGIKKKYKELISYFDDFDLYNPPKVLQEDSNWYVLGWVGYSRIYNVTIFEVVNNVHIIFETAANKETMKREGLNQHQINELSSKLSKKLEWKFPNTMLQSEIIQSVSKDIETKLDI